MKTKLITLLFAVAVSVGTSLAQSGKCGTFLTWDITDGVLIISGSGDMTNWNSYNKVPWYSYRDQITSVTIGNSVTSIGDEAFEYCRGLTSVTIPNSVTSIGKHAFSDCYNLTSVAIGNNVTSIEYYAFCGCSSLTSVTIPNSVKSIGYRAFEGCTSLTSVTIGNGVTSIGDGGFQGCTSLTSVTIGNGVTSIGEYAFQRCLVLKSVSIPKSVIKIGQQAFEWCSSLMSIIVENGNATYDSRDNCNAIIETATNTLVVGCQNTIIPNSVTSIGSYAFSDCNSLTTIEIPNSITSIGNSAFWYCTGLTSVHISDLSAWCNITFDDNPLNYAHHLFLNDTEITDLVIPNSVTSIGDDAFHGCSGLTSVMIPNSITSIGECAFYGCSGLTSVTIGNSVTSIGGDAFHGCSGLTSVTIPNSVTRIGKCAFYGCSGLMSPVYNVHVFAYLPTSYSGAYAIPDGIESIAGGAFRGCTSLSSVTIPNSVTSIGVYTFGNCSGLSSIYVPCWEVERFIEMLSEYSDKVKYEPLPYKTEVLVNNSAAGVVDIPEYSTICDNPLTLNAVPNYGYHFTQWSDGTTDNPRIIELLQDTTFTAEFEKNAYTIATQVNNAEWGSTSGDASILYLDNAEIAATANYGYHFVQWSDGNTDNLRIITVTKDETYTAVFAKNVYSITKIVDNGVISGPSQAEYLDNVTLTAVPNYGYHFVQWSDGNTDNPRTFVLTQDTTFTAEFAVDRSGICGDNNALRWTYDVEAKTLTISGEGTLNSNYTFGVEAPSAMEKLVIAEGVTTVGNSAFAERATLKHISVSESVETIYEQAFYNCTGLQEIYSYRAVPSTAYSNTFDGINKFNCFLYVLSSSIDMYKAATGWRDFYYINPLEVFARLDTFTAGTQDVWICETELPYNWSPIPGKFISVNAEGTYHDTIPTLADYRVDIYTLNLTVNKKLVDDVRAETICGGDYYDWKDAAGNLIERVYHTKKYEHTVYYLDEAGAPTTCVKEHYELSLTCLIEDTIGYGYGRVVCEGADYEWKDIDGNVLKTFENVDEDIFDTISVDYEGTSCLAAVHILHLRVEKLVTYEDKVEVNVGDTFSWFGNEYIITKNEEFDKYFTDDITGCDTAHYHTIVTVLPRYTIDVTANNLEYGTVEGGGTFPPKTSVTISATANYGYHFVQWSDGIKDNPRTIELTQDTTFTAEFAVDRSGICGDNNALRWTYDVEVKTLTISGEGTLNSNYTFGVEAPSAMEKLVIAEGVTTVGNGAFANRTTLQHISLPTTIKTIYEQAFYNCTGLAHIFSYREKPAVAYSNTFDGIDKFECTLHVLSASVDMYKVATGWRDFYYIETIDAGTETEPVEEVTVTPTETTANIIWPFVQLAASYEITIRDLFGNVIFRLVFNAQGQLTGISFAPSRGKQQEQIEGFNFTVTGLSSGTSYAYSIVAKDNEDKELDTKQGTFKTTSNDPMAIDEILESSNPQIFKFVKDGQLYILRDDKVYTIQGQEVE